MLRFLTAGESHGPGLALIIDGLPAGLELTEEYLENHLRRRQGGYGRGGRMAIEKDRAQILSGLHQGRTTGAPMGLLIENKDWPNWKDKEVPPSTIPRPGHAELAGATKYGHTDLRIIAERASARNTATLVAAGAVARRLLEEFDITIFSQVTAIGGVRASSFTAPEALVGASIPNLADLIARIEGSSVHCPDPEAEQAMRQAIDEARAGGDTLGGIFEVYVVGVPTGLGSYVSWDRRLDGRLAQAIMSIMAIKGVEIGAGFDVAGRRGTEVHDQLFVQDGRIVRQTNRAGGIEGGVSNGEPIVIRAAMKPIPTTITPQHSVDLQTNQSAPTKYQRSDICAVPAAGVIGEAMAAWVIADALVEKCGGDSLTEIRRNVAAYRTSTP